MIYGFFYRVIMRIAHKFNWHYAPPSYPNGDTLLWCHWCGMRDVVRSAKLAEIGRAMVSEALRQRGE